MLLIIFSQICAKLGIIYGDKVMTVTTNKYSYQYIEYVKKDNDLLIIMLNHSTLLLIVNNVYIDISKTDG